MTILHTTQCWSLIYRIGTSNLESGSGESPKYGQIPQWSKCLTHWLLVIKWVCQDANMTSILVMELTAAIGGLRLLANNGIVSLAWISIWPWLVNALWRASNIQLRRFGGILMTGQNCPSIACLDAIWQLRSNIWANWYTSGLYGEGSWQGWNPTASRQFILQRSMC